MSEWVDVCLDTELAPGACTVVDVEDVMLAVFNIDGEFYAIEDVCTHDGSEIASGRVIGSQIECPRHGARFCIKTGGVKSPPAYEPIDTFPVQLVGNRIQVRDPRWDE